MIGTVGGFILAVAIILFIVGIRIIRPNQKGAIERLGKYIGPSSDGFNWIIPVIDKLVVQDTAEKMMDVESFEAITKERLNTQIDLVVFYKVKDDKESIYKSLYRVQGFERQVIRIAQTTARNIIGKMSFEKVNSERDSLNTQLKNTLEKQSDAWGVEIVRVETKEITPPENVQGSMNDVLMAENEKTAAINRATAKETAADGEKRAAIKRAQGIAQGKIIIADAEAQKIQKINTAIVKYFKGKAIDYKKMDVAQASLQNNSKIVLTEKGINPQLIIGNIPLDK